MVGCLSDLRMRARAGISSCGLSRGRGGTEYVRHVVLLIVADAWRIIGVVTACLAWPVVTRISSAPRWLFFRLAIAVTPVLWLRS